MNASLMADVIRRADSMKVFSDDEPTFILKEWRTWYNEFQWMTPKEFKKMYRSQVHECLTPKTP